MGQFLLGARPILVSTGREVDGGFNLMILEGFGSPTNFKLIDLVVNMRS